MPVERRGSHRSERFSSDGSRERTPPWCVGPDAAAAQPQGDPKPPKDALAKVREHHGVTPPPPPPPPPVECFARRELIALGRQSGGEGWETATRLAALPAMVVFPKGADTFPVECRRTG